MNIDENRYRRELERREQERREQERRIRGW